ncbi:SDR family oxidoreductase [Paenibacillus antri]|uniref:SDR family oxidoreductase n=1 Tax=Paenibacillus antri TaxID=2582848 RepID=A0A5R9GKC7_9BACL|nr:SDR family oxidoreductase [Paenibacillus antri]TLS53423.1 SDR family oxidoreductase [Paenibacillus antri]
MKIVIVGGTGLIGKKMIARLQSLGHETAVASPSAGVDSVTGEGLAKAIRGAQVVVDVTNSPSFERDAVMSFFQKSTRNLLAAEAAAGAVHHVALSVVGADRLEENDYLRAKRAQEKLIETSEIPYTIVRATQFYEFAGTIAYTATEGQTVNLPSALVQPIAADDVAEAMVDYALAAPANGVVEIAGPERLGLDEFVRVSLRASRDERQVVTDDSKGYFGAPLQAESLVPVEDGARIASTRLGDWLARLGTQA